MVIEALTLMREHEVDDLPVYENGHFVGNVSHRELLGFLNRHENGRNVYFHKLNFDLGTAMIVIREMRGTSNNTYQKLTWVAAIAVAMLGVAWLFFKAEPTKSTMQYASGKIVPGSNKAVLILANGSRISLTQAVNGVLVDGAGFKATKTEDGQLSYKVNGVGVKAETDYHTIETPNGGQYQVLLADGTKIWLNAGSSIKFPSTFAALGARKVFLTGEAYFEVAKDKTHPFLVSSKGQEIEVLGTHFNVSAYGNESTVKTTLLEGSVKVSAAHEQLTSVVLKPNQQAVLQGNHIDVKETDAEDAVGWKNGDFVFRNEPLENIMLKVARWYDIEVVYQDKQVAKEPFGGVIPKFSNISEVLKALELTGDVHFKIQDRKILVTR